MGLDDFSALHKTIHLTANVGAGGENNLSWNHYEGFAFLSYEILRGSSPDSLEFIRAFHGSQAQWPFLI